MPTKITKITEATRQFALRRPLKPAVIRDAETAGLCLVITTRRGFWCQFLQPRGRDQDGKRWRMVRHELGDALQMTVADARTASLAAKAAIRQLTAKDWPPRPPPYAYDRSFRRPSTTLSRSTPPRLGLKRFITSAKPFA
jgi:hypothetical protein